MTHFSPRAKTLLADTGLVYAAAIWGATFFMVKGALDSVDPVVMVGYRFVGAGLLLLAYLLYKRHNVLTGIGPALTLGVVLWVLYVPQTIGLEYTTASNSGFITGLFVLFVPLLMLTVFRQRPTLLETVASVVSLIGLWILTGGMSDVNVGDFLTLITAVAYALHLLLADRYMKRGLNPLVLSCQQFLVVGTLSFLTALVFDLPLA
ncbi:MAG: DMT family transporter, partial [candidate division Zixibacteria bacterium]|nr:DMT family transporter [candidate division Zixibacteria bacterium]